MCDCFKRCTQGGIDYNRNIGIMLKPESRRRMVASFRTLLQLQHCALSKRFQSNVVSIIIPRGVYDARMSTSCPEVNQHVISSRG